MFLNFIEKKSLGKPEVTVSHDDLLVTWYDLREMQW